MPKETLRPNPEMIALARKSRGLTRADLAAKLQISAALMSRIENGVRAATTAVIEALCSILHYPVDFFFQPDAVYGFGTSELFHRKRQDVGIRLLDRIHARINIQRMHFARLLQDVEIAECKFRQYSSTEFPDGPADVARVVRALWAVPTGPIVNMTRIIESAGGVVIPFDFGTRSIDAISQWPPGLPPLFFVNSEAPTDRLRLTLAHEIGHVTLHMDDPHEDMERDANHFAAEFLMPEAEIKPYFHSLTLPKLATLKTHWRVSMAALLKRAGDLDQIGTRQARSLWTQLSSAGFRTREPAELDLPPERPSLFMELFEVYRGEFGYSTYEMSQALHMFEDEVELLYYTPAPRLKLVSYL